MWTYNLKERLKAISSEHAVVVSEHEFTPKADRERLFELMFEKFNTPAVFSSKQSVLSWLVSRNLWFELALMQSAAMPMLEPQR